MSFHIETEEERKARRKEQWDKLIATTHNIGKRVIPLVGALVGVLVIWSVCSYLWHMDDKVNRRTATAQQQKGADKSAAKAKPPCANRRYVDGMPVSCDDPLVPKVTEFAKNMPPAPDAAQSDTKLVDKPAAPAVAETPKEEKKVYANKAEAQADTEEVEVTEELFGPRPELNLKGGLRTYLQQERHFCDPSAMSAVEDFLLNHGVEDTDVLRTGRKITLPKDLNAAFKPKSCANIRRTARAKARGRSSDQTAMTPDPIRP